MRRWDHDELHTLIYGNPALKEKSDRVHALPQTDSLDDWRDGKCQMMGIYIEAVGCQNAQTAKAFVKEVFEHIKSHSSSKKEWLGIASLSRHTQALEILCQKYAEGLLCHAPDGNNYVCYCNKK